jgi:hypothetical protein
VCHVDQSPLVSLVKPITQTLVNATAHTFLYGGSSADDVVTQKVFPPVRRRCVFITAVPIIKLFAWGEGDSGGHVIRETTSRGLRRGT